MKRCMRFINVQLEKVGNKIKSISFFKDKVNIVFLNEWKMEISKDTYTDFYLYEGKELDKEVNRLVQPYQNLYSEQEMEELKSKLYSISIQSERAGFILGVKWMMRLLLEIFMQ